MVNRLPLLLLALGASLAAAAVLHEDPRGGPSTSLEISAPSASASIAAGPASASASVELEQLASRRELYESVDALVQASEFEKARRLLDDDQARFGDDLPSQWRDLAQSYRLMADCLEHPTAHLRSRARAFVVVSEAQGLKPRVLSACGLASRE